MAIVYLSLGSNAGDRVGYVQQAASMLGEIEDTNLVESSSLYETEPWHMKTDNWFVNAVIALSTNLEPEKLLEECHRIENILGRKRGDNSTGFKDRTIDIDILFYDDKVITTDELIIPHRFIQRRAFVLVPMLEIAQDFVHPVLKKNISTLFDELESPEQVFLYGTRV